MDYNFIGESQGGEEKYNFSDTDLSHIAQSQAKKPPEPESGTSTLGEYASTLGQAVKQVPGYIAQAVEGGTPFTEPGLASDIVESAKQSQKEFEAKPGGEEEALGGLAKKKEIREAAPSIASSLAGLAPALAGAGIGSVVPGVGTLAGGILGGLASLPMMARSTESSTVRALADKAAAEKGSTLTPEELLAVQEKAQGPALSKMGYAEAIPEVAGTALEAAIARASLPGKAAGILGALVPKNAVARALGTGAAKALGVTGTELAEETATQQMQQPQSVELGLEEGRKRELLNPSDIAESFKEVAKPTTLATLPMAALGLGGGAIQGYRSAKPTQAHIEAAQQPTTGEVAEDAKVKAGEDVIAAVTNPDGQTSGTVGNVVVAAAKAGVSAPQVNAAAAATDAVTNPLRDSFAGNKEVYDTWSNVKDGSDTTEFKQAVDLPWDTLKKVTDPNLITPQTISELLDTNKAYQNPEVKAQAQEILEKTFIPDLAEVNHNEMVAKYFDPTMTIEKLANQLAPDVAPEEQRVISAAIAQKKVNRAEQFIREREKKIDKPLTDAQAGYLNKIAQDFGLDTTQMVEPAQILEGIKAAIPTVREYATKNSTYIPAEPINAQSVTETAQPDASRGTQPTVRQEGQNEVVSSTGVPVGGQAQGNLSEEKISDQSPYTAPQEAETKEQITPDRPIDYAISQFAATSPHNNLPTNLDQTKNQKANVEFQGLPVEIENAVGSKRFYDEGQNFNTMTSHYGGIVGTVGKDGDPVDVFIPNGLTQQDIDSSKKAYIINQVNPTEDGTPFDEHKVVLAVNSPEEALDTYKSNYKGDWQGADIDSVHEIDIPTLKQWLRNGDKTAPYGEDAFEMKAAPDTTEAAPVAATEAPTEVPSTSEAAPVTPTVGDTVSLGDTPVIVEKVDAKSGKVKVKGKDVSRVVKVEELQPAKPVATTLREKAAEMHSKADDWASRKYKDSKLTYAASDQYGQDAGNRSVVGANERRRQRNVSELRGIGNALDSYANILDTLEPNKIAQVVKQVKDVFDSEIGRFQEKDLLGILTHRLLFTVAKVAHAPDADKTVSAIIQYPDIARTISEELLKVKATPVAQAETVKSDDSQLVSDMIDVAITSEPEQKAAPKPKPEPKAKPVKVVQDATIDKEGNVFKAFKKMADYQAPRSIPEEYKTRSDVSPKIAYIMDSLGFTKEEAAKFVFIQRHFLTFISNQPEEALGIHGIGTNKDNPNPTHGKVQYEC